MNEERRIVLEMLKDGKITVEEAEQLLNTLSSSEKTNEGPVQKPRHLRVIVESGGHEKVNMKLPYPWLHFGKMRGITFGVPTWDESGEVARALKDLDIDDLLHKIEIGEENLPYTFMDFWESDRHIRIVLE